MALKAVWGLVVAAMLGGCSAAGGTACQCPKPIHYGDATEKKIQAALEALSNDNILHQAMEDYEDERDDLRFCR